MGCESCDGACREFVERARVNQQYHNEPPWHCLVIALTATVLSAKYLGQKEVEIIASSIIRDVIQCVGIALTMDENAVEDSTTH